MLFISLFFIKFFFWRWDHKAQAKNKTYINVCGFLTQFLSWFFHEAGFSCISLKELRYIPKLILFSRQKQKLTSPRLRWRNEQFQRVNLILLQFCPNSDPLLFEIYNYFTTSSSQDKRVFQWLYLTPKLKESNLKASFYMRLENSEGSAKLVGLFEKSKNNEQITKGRSGSVLTRNTAKISGLLILIKFHMIVCSKLFKFLFN